MKKIIYVIIINVLYIFVLFKLQLKEDKFYYFLFIDRKLLKYAGLM